MTLASVPGADAAVPSCDSIKGALGEELAETRTPGAALIVVEDGVQVCAEGLGVASAETSQPITPSTVFQVGSVTKMFTATAALIAAERGQVSLEDPIARRVAGLPPWISGLTLSQLLSQTAGLADEPAEYGDHDEKALETYVRTWTDERLLLSPGRSFSYSNPGYTLAGYVLQAIAGKPFASLMDETVLSPLGMAHSTFRPTVAMTQPLAVGHRLVVGKIVVVRPMADDTRHWPAGYLYTSASDLARFVTDFVNAGTDAGHPALRVGVVGQMSKPRSSFPRVFDGDAYGYGLFIDHSRGLPVLGHGGQMPGFSAHVRMAPARKAAIVLLANREGQMFRRTLGQALDEFVGAAGPTPSVEALPLTSDEMMRLTGVYKNRWTMELLVRERRLFLRWAGEDRAVTRVGERTFSVLGPSGESVVFAAIPGPSGKPDALQMFIWAFKRAP